MAASAVCRAAGAGTRVLLRTRRSPALLRSSDLRGTATYAQALQSVPETQVSQLDNGLRVASEQSSQPTCTVGVWIDAGSRYETEKNNGAGYFVEHLAFKGTKNRPGNALEKEVESMGAHLNAYTTREHTAYYIKALSKDLPKAVELLADIVQNCSLEDSQIEKERDVILQELQENDTSMRDVVFNYLHATAFQGTPLAQSVEGPSENVRKLSRADLTDYLNRHYKAPRMVLAAAGGLEHRQLLDLAQKHFSGLSGTYDEDAVPTLTPCRFTGSEIRHREDGLPLAHVAIAVEGPGWANPDNVALQVANAIIGHYDCTYGGGMHLSSPLASVAATNKLCQSFQTFNICYADTGLLGAHFVCDHMSIDDMMFVLQGQWMRLCTSATESEVVRGKNLLRNALVSHLDGTTPVCEDIGRSLLTYGRRIPLAEWESRIAVTGRWGRGLRESRAGRLAEGGELRQTAPVGTSVSSSVVCLGGVTHGAGQRHGWLSGAWGPWKPIAGGALPPFGCGVSSSVHGEGLGWLDAVDRSPGALPLSVPSASSLFVAMAACRPMFESREDGPWFVR